MTYVCPVCGFENLEEEPRDGAGEASFEICKSCGFQFGVTDDDLGYSYEQWRARWVAAGYPWHGVNGAPKGWSGRLQLSHLGS